MTTFFCVECGGSESERWWQAAEGRWLCKPCRQSILDTFALAATLGISGVDLLLAVCDD